MVCLNTKRNVFQAHLSLLLVGTPDKRPFEKGELQQDINSNMWTTRITCPHHENHDVTTNSGIVKVSIKGTRISGGLDIFHMEITGFHGMQQKSTPWRMQKKPIQTDIINLIAVLQNHIDYRISLATKIKTYAGPKEPCYIIQK
ncbi:hypothetical protein Glove_74g122 [Diversispora epigaea]|uniref:Uncharacterized protein n=1 Tax=Diversispora epigaea TaxID=1348612 RepID=A0A397J940_9GLOM|nr:hypothetical protein Glove_74g122 [Diversispora epigaea]